MQTYNNLFNKLCSYKNLLRAFNEAKKGKTCLPYVVRFNKDLRENLLQLKKELWEQTYKPEKLTTFILRDPKLRIISKAIFKDRVVHHAIFQVLEPILDKTFIYDSCANRINKGTSKALERFQLFLRRVSKNGKNCYNEKQFNGNLIKGYALKLDIKHYFETVDQAVLINIIKRKIKDEKIIWLIRQILDNFESNQKGKGMPLGNLTSQFFANIYLNDLDYFIKHILKIKYYVRYVDDFVILHSSKEQLRVWKEQINEFLKENLKLELHPTKSKIVPLFSGVPFVGFRIFYNHMILRKKAIRRIKARIEEWKELYDLGLLEIYKALEKLAGWIAYAINANTHYLRKKIISKFNKLIST